MVNVIEKMRRALVRLNGLPKQISKVEHDLDLLKAQMADHNREMRLLLDALSEPPQDLWKGKPHLIQGEPVRGVFDQAGMCRQDSFEEPYFSYWISQLGEAPRYHRKQWEFVFICQALWERGLLVDGKRALGFGVGREPLTALFASRGVSVTATDLAFDGAVDLGWTTTNQHAEGKEALRKPWLCSDEIFDAKVDFRECDMNAIPQTLQGYDFCWSACALEHLGSIEKGLTFIERSVDCLAPGGWAVHTTEFNVSSNLETVDDMETVLFRRRDLEQLAQRLTAKGHIVTPISWDAGSGPLDRYIDVAPYKAEPHLKLALNGFAATSIGFIVQRGGA
ncbi:methyltransferase domain-containing protein [Pseudomonas sp. ODNR1LW]|nr:methyltransferase domain-containing protein [Pseudomonas sp. ODNR1LW]